MKHFNRNFFGIIIVCYCAMINADSQNFTSTQLATLQQERSTNLVIINDVKEYFSSPDLLMSELIDKSKKLIVHAMQTDFLRTMSSNQLVLCPRLFWHSVQNIIVIFNKFISDDFGLYPMGSYFIPYSAQCRKLKDIYDQINLVHASSDNKKSQKLQSLIKQFQNVLNDSAIYAHLRWNVQEIFATYMYYDNIMRQGYVCKQVTKKSTDSDTQENDFLLFVPKAVQNAGEDANMQNALLGFSWTNLPDYDYEKLRSDSDFKQILDDASNTNSMKLQGERLLKVLQTLKFANADVPRESLPFLNVYLSGHGSKDSITAELSIVPKQNKDGSVSASDFVKVLNFFNHNFRTQSLVLVSCYPGGKKLVDTYNINNYYSNVGLEDISYPLIMIGSALLPTSTSVISEGLISDKFIKFSAVGLYLPLKPAPVAQYFARLNSGSPDYEKAVRIISEGTENVEQKVSNIRNPQNYASIKFPHVAWFSVAQFSTYVKQLSQVAMSTADKPIVISKDVKLLLLSANYIPQPILFEDSTKLPKLLPVNYMNQNYCFESVIIDKELDVFAGTFKQFFVPKIQEPVNIIFKKLTFTTATLSNTLIFMHQDLYKKGVFLSGYVYSLAPDQTKLASWPSSKPVPNPIMENFNDRQVFEVYIDRIFNAIKANLPEALTEEFVSTLSSKLNSKKSKKIFVDPTKNWVKDPKTGKWKEVLKISSTPGG